MSGFELNKLFAAVLCAFITVMLVGYAAETIVAPEALEQDAVAIEAASGDSGSSAAAKPKLPDPIMALLAEADTAKGAKISKACAACHSFDKGGPVKQGPSLWGVVGHSKGAAAGFAYSDDMKAKGGIWDYDSLNHFLTKPKKYISGTKMNFAGIKKPADRAAIIAWLREQSDAPFALPTDADIAAEQAAFAPPAEEAAEESAPAEATHH
tara:strand:+ start:617 stop:1246 length:630 start_codon:yes stop_codon:yes gene_type:complete